MVSGLRAPALVPGLATGIGSLPHTDPRAAAELVLRCLPDLPAAPQLPGRDPREGMIAQWAAALPEVSIAPDGAVVLGERDDREPRCGFQPDAHAGLLAFLDAAGEAERPPARVKVQLTGPLTLGVALHRAGMPSGRAFRRAAGASREWAGALGRLGGGRRPGRRP